MGWAVVHEQGNYPGQSGIWICDTFTPGFTPVFTRYYDAYPNGVSYMAVDPNDPIMRQFLFSDNNGGEIWLLDRNISDTFVKVLDLATAQTIAHNRASAGLAFSEHIGGVFADPVRPDTFYTGFSYFHWESGWQNYPNGDIIRTTDGGATWEHYQDGPLPLARGIGQLDAYDGRIAIGGSSCIFFGCGVVAATDDVTSPVGDVVCKETSSSIGLSGWSPGVKYRSKDSGSISLYCNSASGDLLRASSPPSIGCDPINWSMVTLSTGLWSSYAGEFSGLWIDPDDPTHHILMTSTSALGSGMYVTHDEWLSSVFTPITSSYRSLHNLQVVESQLFYMKKRRLYYLPNENSTSADEIDMSGNLPDLGANSSYNGLFVRLHEPPPPIVTTLRVHAVEGEPNFFVEEPLHGDRSVRDVLAYEVRHTNEVSEDHFHIHVPHGIHDGDIIVWDEANHTWKVEQPSFITVYVADLVATPVSTGVSDYVYADGNPIVVSV